MIACVHFDDFEQYLFELGFERVRELHTSFVYARKVLGVTEALSIHRPHVHNGDITEQAMIAACEAAGLDPPSLAVHWGD